MLHLPAVLLLGACAAEKEPPPPPPILLPAEDVGPPAAPGEVAPSLAPSLTGTAAAEPDRASPGLTAASAPAPTENDLAGILGGQAPSPERAEAYAAVRPKSVIELQQWRESTTVEVRPGSPERLTATLLDLNPWVHEWFIVQLQFPSGEARTYHLENHDPQRVRVWLDPAWPEGLSLRVDGVDQRCALWPAEGSPLELARVSGQPFASLCEGRIALRNPTEGRSSALESTTDFLRDHVWGGEQITTLVKETIYKDSELATSELVQDGGAAVPQVQRAPAPPAVDPAVQGQQLVPVNLGFELEGAPTGRVAIGEWYPVDGSPGLYLSTIQPRFVDPALLADWGTGVHPMGVVEGSALAFVTAFDLDSHELYFDLGTSHPRVGWSERAPAAVRDANLPGPDGFDKIGPLVRSGIVNPANVPRLVATFTGGFRRGHGAFKVGEYSLVNSGTHYGWIEHGVVESKLQPGLATLVVDVDGGVDVRVWTAQDDAALWRIRFARQNGVPIVLPGEDGRPRPGALVPYWGAGNWSGSAEGELRSVRAAVCVQDSAQGRYLLYAYFSSVTPSGMARVMAAYGCGVAMLTDMNALEHTYLSIHHFHEGRYEVHHLIRGMEVLDKERQGVYLPRFVGLADNRDFFTVLRRTP